jgi:hypothetical protein
VTDRESRAIDLVRDLLPLLDPSASARWDTLAELFYRETGIMAPGKRRNYLREKREGSR